ASVSGVKVTIVAGMSKDVVAKGVQAGDLVREIAPIVGGSGGGKPALAQAGGKNPDAVPEALAQAEARLREQLG
ncbi:MAG: DHHA1 domain-containing protein, partial [Planctomycetota bacterium]